MGVGYLLSPGTDDIWGFGLLWRGRLQLRLFVTLFWGATGRSKGVNIGVGVGLELSLGYVASGILCHPLELKDRESNMSVRDSKGDGRWCDPETEIPQSWTVFESSWENSTFSVRLVSEVLRSYCQTSVRWRINESGGPDQHPPWPLRSLCDLGKERRDVNKSKLPDCFHLWGLKLHKISWTQ